MAHYIILLKEVVDAAEKAKGYWDETGLDMHIAVKKNGTIAVSTKHWGRVHYIVPPRSMDPKEIWEKVLYPVADQIGRKLVLSLKGKYVYIHKLSIEQTQTVFNKIKDNIGQDYTIERRFEWNWDIDDAVLPSTF